MGGARCDDDVFCFDLQLFAVVDDRERVAVDKRARTTQVLHATLLEELLDAWMSPGTKPSVNPLTTRSFCFSIVGTSMSTLGAAGQGAERHR